MEFSAFLLFSVWTSSMTYLTFGKERERAMVFPDYYFFAERRLVNHTIDEKRVKNLDDCELFCYLTDDCVSLNYKKDSENDKTGYNCELNNATHLKYASDLTTHAKFYYRGSKNACDKSSHCQNNATCQSGFTFKGYRCLCPPGFEGEHCEKDIDKCEAFIGKCHKEATCNNTYGSYVCICKPGFIGDGHNCTDIDECETNPQKCHAKAVCNNTHGSYVCTCKPGFIGDGQNCTDIDECKTYPGKCHVNATCNNTHGLYVCTCKPGYTGNGHNCTDIDECREVHVDKIKQCHPSASCINTQGSYNCSCNPDYIGDGFSCEADPCINYNELNDSNRKSSYATPASPVLCDDTLPVGWYRFVGAAGTKMATTTVDRYHCGTALPGWLHDDHPTVEEGKARRRVFFSDGSFIFIEVKNCGSFYIYNILKPPGCKMRYCGSD